MALTANKVRRLENARLMELFEDHRDLWREMAKQAFEYAAISVEKAGERVRPDDVTPILVPALELTEVLTTFLARERLSQLYWYTYFAELILDRFWADLRRDHGKEGE